MSVNDALFSIPHGGGHIVPAADFDGDGWIDLLVQSGGGAPDLELVSTGRRETLWNVPVRGNSSFHPTLRSAGTTWSHGGTLDGDSIPDLLLVAHADPRLEGIVAVAGSTGDLLWDRPVPGAKAGDLMTCFVDDLDGDGVTDYAVSDSDRVSIHSGRTGKEVWSLQSEREDHLVARRIVPMPDLGGDGKRDLIVQPARESSMPILVCSGVDGRVLLRLDNIGTDVTPAGDLNGDGACDLFRNEVNYGQRVDVLDGKSGVLLFDLFYPRGESPPGSPIALGDLDGDRVDDFALSDPSFHLHGKDCSFKGKLVDLAALSLADALALDSQSGESTSCWSSGCVLVYSGRTRKPITGVWGSCSTGCIGRTVAALPDVSGDGWPDLLVDSSVFVGPGPAMSEER